MDVIKTIDLWTEVHDNDYECFNGAFIDGFANNNLPFDRYKIVKNCNCIIDVQAKDINITNKHQAIIFYKDNRPVRLLVINKNTNLNKCMISALNQFFDNEVLKDIYKNKLITSTTVDLEEEPIYNNCDKSREMDVGSCDRWILLYNMLKGSYTEDDSPYGNYQSTNYEFLPNLVIIYRLVTDTEIFEIVHKCGFINDIKTRIVPIQEDSPLTSSNN